MAEPLDLTVDEVLTTTRAVRRRLDLTRPVERSVIEECLDLALQAPNAANRQLWHWVVVDDPAVRRDVVAVVGEALALGSTSELGLPPVDWATPAGQRMAASVQHLFDHLADVPVLVVPAIEGRPGANVADQALVWGSILPACWSFLLALRSRGLGSAWTTVHLSVEERMAEVLGIPYPAVTQAGLFPVAHTIGTEFRPGGRERTAEILHWNRW